MVVFMVETFNSLFAGYLPTYLPTVPVTAGSWWSFLFSGGPVAPLKVLSS